MNTLFIIIRSLLFNFLFFNTTFILGIVCLPLLLSQKASVELSGLWAKLTIYYLKIICGIKISYKGYKKLDNDSNIFALRHESVLDTILFLDYFINAKYIMKKELKYIPLYGWFAVRCGHIVVNRKGGASGLKEMLNKVEEKLMTNTKLIIFPHGTRIKVGQSKKIQSGIYAIYKYIDTSIVPVYLSTGNEWDINGFTKRPGNIDVVFSERIKEGLDKAQFIRQLESKINP